MAIGIELAGANLALGGQFVDKAWPFGTECVCSGERAVTAADSKAINAINYKVMGGLEASLAGSD